jgi:hypothetical protein
LRWQHIQGFLVWFFVSHKNGTHGNQSIKIKIARFIVFITMDKLITASLRY